MNKSSVRSILVKRILHLKDFTLKDLDLILFLNHIAFNM